MSNKSGSGTSDIIPIQSGQSETHPRGIIDAISNIEYYHAQEKRGAILSAGFFTLKQKIEYFEVGFRGSFISGLITAMITPIAIGVTEHLIPVFGSTSPSAFDNVFVFMLAFGFWLGYSCFIARAASLYIGPYTRSMIRSFVGGVRHRQDDDRLYRLSFPLHGGSHQESHCRASFEIIEAYQNGDVHRHLSMVNGVQAGAALVRLADRPYNAYFRHDTVGGHDVRIPKEQ